MDTVGIVAVCVSTLGTALIIACVFLSYKYYQVKQLNERLAAPADDSSILETRSQRTKKLVVHRGKVIPARQSWTPSFRSGWTSMRRRSWMLASTMAMPSMPSWNRTAAARNSNDLENQRPGSARGLTALTPVLDADDASYTSSPQFTSDKNGMTATAVFITNQLPDAQPKLKPALINATSPPPAPTSPRVPSRAKTHRSITKQQKQRRSRTAAATPSPHLDQQHASSPKQTLPQTQTFPRPPYLSPIQSRRATTASASPSATALPAYTFPTEPLPSQPQTQSSEAETTQEIIYSTSPPTASLSSPTTTTTTHPTQTFYYPPTPSAKSFRSLSVSTTRSRSSAHRDRDSYLAPVVESADLALMPRPPPARADSLR